MSVITSHAVLSGAPLSRQPGAPINVDEGDSQIFETRGRLRIQHTRNGR